VTHLARRLSNLIAAIVLVVSGVYLIVYLYRWEWNRAVVAGLFFVATEIAVATRVLFSRLRSIERRLDGFVEPSAEHHADVVDRLRATAPAPNRSFAWLDRRGDSMSVFVPVLLGAGVLLSAFASVVERLGSMTAVPAMERGLAGRLDALALPAGGLLGAIPELPPTTRSHVAARMAARVFAVVALGFLALVTVNTVADNTQDRPDPPMTGQSVVTMEVTRRFSSRGVTETAEALFVVCRHTIPHSRQLSGFAVDGRLATITITPAIGEHAERRLIGCLQDANFDRVSASVREVRKIP
jgi:hypothetical protein